MSLMQASGLGTIGAAFLYLDALKRQAILTFSIIAFRSISA